MRIAITVSLLAGLVGIAGAAPPSGYQCAPGKPKAGVGCACPAGHADQRDRENVAMCAVVADDTSAQFVKALASGDLAKATTLASKLDGSTDAKATTALTASFDAWITNAKRDTAAFGAKGRCAAITGAMSRASEYREIWANLMAKLDKRNPAMQAGAMAKGRIDQAIAPVEKTKEACIASAAKEDGSEWLAARWAKDERTQRCIARFADKPAMTVSVNVVVDADGVVVKMDYKTPPRLSPQEKSDPRFCVAMWLREGSHPASTGRGYAARLEVKTGKAAGSTEGTKVPAPAGDVKEQAKQLYTEGETAYNLGNWDQAIDRFKRAYALQPAPAFLFNIAQAYRQKGDKPAAIEYYEAFLRDSPNSSAAAEVRRKIDELKR